MTEVSLLIPPTTQAESGFRILLQGRGLWRDTPTVGGGGVDTTMLRKQMAALIANVAATNANFDQIRGPLRVQTSTFLTQLLDRDVLDLLRAAADEADEDDPPLLRIHVGTGNDWIPWEILHDGEGFLGLRFRIARMPIVVSAPEVPSERTHSLDHVTSVLGSGVVENDNGEFGAWASTFDGLLPDGVEANLMPPDATAAFPDSTPIFEETDILHVTCHGTGGATGAWTLNRDVPEAERWRYRVGSTDLVGGGDTSSLARRRPLVFGNACASAGSVEEDESLDASHNPAVAISFFEGGALNVIGTFAPIRKAMALPFARKFYEFLLDDGESISHALWKTKRSFVDAPPANAPDPTFLFYCLYGPADTVFTAD